MSDYKDLCAKKGLTVVREDGAKDKTGQLRRPVKADYKRVYEMYEKDEGNGRNE